MKDFEGHTQVFIDTIRKYIIVDEFVILYKSIENNYACFWEQQSGIESDIVNEQKNFEKKVNKTTGELDSIQKELFEQLSKENGNEAALVKENLRRNEI